MMSKPEHALFLKLLAQYFVRSNDVYYLEKKTLNAYRQVTQIHNMRDKLLNYHVYAGIALNPFYAELLPSDIRHMSRSRLYRYRQKKFIRGYILPKKWRDIYYNEYVGVGVDVGVDVKAAVEDEAAGSTPALAVYDTTVKTDVATMQRTVALSIEHLREHNDDIDTDMLYDAALVNDVKGMVDAGVRLAYLDEHEWIEGMYERKKIWYLKR